MYLPIFKDQAHQNGTPRAQVGIYLRISLTYARSVHLILNLLTGLVSTQYHVKFDNTFQNTDKMNVLLKRQKKFHVIVNNNKDKLKS
jgi:hypothetical protein